MRTLATEIGSPPGNGPSFPSRVFQVTLHECIFPYSRTCTYARARRDRSANNRAHARARTHQCRAHRDEGKFAIRMPRARVRGRPAVIVQESGVSASLKEQRTLRKKRGSLKANSPEISALLNKPTLRLTAIQIGQPSCRIVHFA